jgi:hypothetical protein
MALVMRVDLKVKTIRRRDSVRNIKHIQSSC